MMLNAKKMDWLVEQVIDYGGEGLILQKKSSLYEHGRSPSLIKLKNVQADEEGVVVSINDDGGVSLKLLSGATLIVPKQNINISTVPSVGSIVTFSYENNSRRDVPVHPTITRTRTDVLWDDLVLDFNRSKMIGFNEAKFTSRPIGNGKHGNLSQYVSQFLSGLNISLQPTNLSSIFKQFRIFMNNRGIFENLKEDFLKSVHHLFPKMALNKFDLTRPWNNIENRRLFFEDYAKYNNFNAQDPSNWYMQLDDEIMALHGAQTVISYHNNSTAQALLDLFPNIGLEKSKLLDRTIYWSKPDNRRKFFENYAVINGFDAHNPEHWYAQSRSKIMTSKNALMVVHYHNNSVSQALIDLFPEIGLEKNGFPTRHVYWYKIENRRRFFEEFAKENGFNPYVAQNWYNQAKDSIEIKKDAQSVLQYHNNSVVTALMDLFPDIGLDKSQFCFTKNYWDSVENQKLFFINYAKESKFDPFVASNWYWQSKERLEKTKGYTNVVNYYDGDLATSVVTLFPDVGFEISKFKTNGEFWTDPVNQRKFFEQYATDNNFNYLSADNWYSQTRNNILAVPGASKLLYHHKNSVPMALLNLFPEIGLDKLKFHVRQNFWSNPKTRRSLFEEYAKQNNFDPLVPENWYLQSKEDILAFKGALSVINYHNNSVSTALVELFPEIGLKKAKFVENYWGRVENRKSFFISYANERGFDPFHADSWLAEPINNIVSFKGISKVLNYHRNSVPRALVELFPDIGLSLSQFRFKKNKTG